MAAAVSALQSDNHPEPDIALHVCRFRVNKKFQYLVLLVFLQAC